MDSLSHDSPQALPDPNNGRKTPDLVAPKGAKSTPRRSTLTHIDLERIENTDRRKRHAEDMTGQFAHTPWEIFIKKLVLGEDPLHDQLTNFSAFEDVDSNGAEPPMYIPLTKGMQTSLAGSGLVARVTAWHPDNNDISEQESDEPQPSGEVLGKTDAPLGGSSSQAQPSRAQTQKRDSGQGSDEPLTSQKAGVKESPSLRYEWKVDISIYDAILDSEGRTTGVSEHDLTLAEQEETRRRKKTKGEDLSLYARTAWHHIVVPVEVKPKNKPLPFTFNVPEGSAVDNDNIGGEATRGQMADYFTKILIRQHRTHIFSIYIHGPMVYLMRWDRAGALVCHPFSLKDEPHKLHCFLYRLTKMTRSQRGYDETVKLATQEEAQMFRSFVPKTLHHNMYKSDAVDTRWPLYTVILPGFNTEVELRLVFGKPRFSSQSLVGRATRGYVAFDLDNKRLVFLKDYWRPGRPGAHPELDVYIKLAKKNVPFIATPLGGGDVGPDADPQRTKTQLFIKDVDPRVHYRFAVREVGRPIEDYETPREMVAVISQALSAHKAAWEDAGVLHRDISCGNILIDDDPPNPTIGRNGRPIPRGFLNDWDLCKYKSELDGQPTHVNHSGTWVFMSSLLLNFPKKPHQVSDDLESFIHVLFWLTIRFQAHWPESKELWSVVGTYEQASRTSDGYDIGNSAKLTNMRRGDPGFDLEYVKVLALADLIKNLLQMCKEHHASLDWEKDLKPYTSVDTAKGFEVVYGGSAKNKRRAVAGGAEAELAAYFDHYEGVGAGEDEEDEGDYDKKEEEEEMLKPTMNNHKIILRLFMRALRNYTGWRDDDGESEKLSRDNLRTLRLPLNALTLPGGSGSTSKRGAPRKDPEDKTDEQDAKRQRLSGPSVIAWGLQSVPEED